MNRRGMGIGFVMVLIVCTIVLILAARAWTSVAPTAQQIMKPGSPGTIPDHGDKDAAKALSSKDLPDLDEMKKRTDRHAAEVKEAADKTQ
jgi:hypothetical protein